MLLSDQDLQQMGELINDFHAACMKKSVKTGDCFVALSSLLISKLTECVVDMNLDPEKAFNQIISDMKCIFESAIEDHKQKMK